MEEQQEAVRAAAKIVIIDMYYICVVGDIYIKDYLAALLISKYLKNSKVINKKFDIYNFIIVIN
jgi:hypothetical protein